MQDPSITITPAAPADLAAVISILNEAADWLWRRQIPQWLPGRFNREDFVRLIEQKSVWLARLDGDPVGTVTLAWDDPLWGPDDRIAGYLHKLAVKRGAAGRGVSAALMRAAEEEIANAGRTWARLDCWAANEALKRFYTDQGYRLRDVVAEENWRVARFEKRLANAP